MMMIKVEIKVRFKNRDIFDRFEKNLKENADEFIGEFHQIDRYFGIPEYDSIYVQDEVLRAREVIKIDEDYNDYSLTYKDAIIGCGEDRFEEKNVSFKSKDDFESNIYILEHIGIPVVLLIDKMRKRYAYRQMIINLDDVKGIGHPYVEIKMMVAEKEDMVKARAMMCSLISEIIGEDEDFIIENRSYLDIVLESCKVK